MNLFLVLLMICPPSVHNSTQTQCLGHCCQPRKVTKPRQLALFTTGHLVVTHRLKHCRRSLDVLGAERVDDADCDPSAAFLELDFTNARIGRGPVDETGFEPLAILLAPHRCAALRG